MPRPRDDGRTPAGYYKPLWYLADAEKPATEKIRPGDRVKLRFQSAGLHQIPTCIHTGQTLPWTFDGENMWVAVTHYQNPVTGFGGLLQSDPLVISATRRDRVSFLPRHVMEVRQTTGWASWAHRILATVEGFLDRKECARCH